MWPKRLEIEQTDSDLNRSTSIIPNSSDISSSGFIGNNRRKSSGSGHEHLGTTDTKNSIEKSCLNVNTNNNSKRRCASPSLSSTSKAPRLSLENSSDNLPKDPSGNNKGFLDGLDISALQRQAMQLAYLQQHQAAALKSGAPASPPEEDSSLRTKNIAAAIAAASVLPNNAAGLPAQVQQLLSQQVLSPNQLQAFMQQHAVTAQHQQAQQIQEIYRKQQKHIQDFQIQMAAAKQQQKGASTMTRSEDTNDIASGNSLSTDIASRLAKDQHQMQQHLAIQQLMHLQQMQQQQQQQQQQVAAAALQQQSLAAAVAMAQGRQSFMPSEVSTDLQQLLLKHVNDVATRKDAATSLPLPNATGNLSLTSTSNQTPPTRNRAENNSRDSINGEYKDVARRISNHRSSRESSPDSSMTGPLQPLYAHGVCKWPGCDIECNDLASFYKHLNEYHRLDDKSTAQYRVQMQVVEQLEKQLNQERDRLDAMMTHLRMDGKEAKCDPDSNEVAFNNNVKQEVSNSKSASQVPPTSGFPGLPLPFPTPNPSTHPSRGAPNLSLPSSPISGQHISGFSSLFPSTSVPSSPPLFGSHLTSSNLTSASREGLLQNVKRRHSAAVPISADLSQNQEFYRNADVRPPFTYASLIRQAIIETPDCQMTLNEIYNWFQKKFAYFRRNAPTWKSAIRTNLSLHKCFMRCEDVMGSYWTVDDREFRKGRHLKRGRPRKYEEKEPIAPRSQSPAVRGRMEVSSSQNFYGAPMNFATMQMAFGDTSFSASQLANQAQAMFAANQQPNYSNFLHNANLSGISHSISADASINMELTDNSSSLIALPSGRTTSISPTSSNDSSKDDSRHNKFLPSHTNLKNGIASEDNLCGNEDEDAQTPDDKQSESRNINSESPPQSREEDMEERASRGSMMSDGSTGEDGSKPLDLHHNLSNPNSGVLRQGMVSARGSFAMLHDHPGTE